MASTARASANEARLVAAIEMAKRVFLRHLRSLPFPRVASRSDGFSAKRTSMATPRCSRHMLPNACQIACQSRTARNRMRFRYLSSIVTATPPLALISQNMGRIFLSRHRRIRSQVAHAAFEHAQTGEENDEVDATPLTIHSLSWQHPHPPLLPSQRHSIAMPNHVHIDVTPRDEPAGVVTPPQP